MCTGLGCSSFCWPVWWDRPPPPTTRAVLHPPPAVRSVDLVAAATRDQLDASRVPAASFAVVDGDDVATGARGTGVSGHTPFILGSVSKSFTALAVMQLRDRGLLQLDTPVSRHVPGFETATAGAVITVRQLLDQTSGLPTSAGLESWTTRAPPCASGFGTPPR